MVNRGGAGPTLARGRALVALAVLVFGGGFLLKHDASSPHSRPTPPTPAQVRASFARLLMSFEPNRGQSDSGVKFLARGIGYGLYLMPAKAILTLPGHSQSGVQQRPSEIEMQLAGANQAAEIAGAETLPGRSNYFIGNDPSRWRRNIPQFGRVLYREVYPGIDLAFYGKQNQLEYDFEVSPGGDPRQIELNFKGATNVSVANNGDLVLALDGRELRFAAPHIYQHSSSGNPTIAGSFVLRGNNGAGFKVGPYDRSRALVIDPVLTFSTYLGGAGEESCSAILGASFVPHCPSVAVDSAGSIYVAGATTSAATGTFSAVTPNATEAKGSENVFIAKITGINSTPSLSFVTYLGGTGSKQYPVGVGADGGFNVYVAGTTDASDFPTTASAYQGTPASSGTNHVFVSQFDLSGSALLYSTYLSGDAVDTAAGMILDSQGKVYVMGTTTSSSFPTTSGALQPCAGKSTPPCPTTPSNQFFLSKVNTGQNGTSSLQYSTYLGGTTPSNAVVTGGAVAVDSSFNVYLAGGTNFTDMPIVNAYQSALKGATNVWAARLNAPANNTQQYTPEYETYLGGSGTDVAYGIASDGTSTYITGSTTSTDITVPTTTTAYQSTNGGGTDAFVAKFGLPVTSGTTQGTVPLDYFSYLGGSGTDSGLAIVADSLGNARLTGLTNSSNFPVIPTAACSSSASTNCNPLQVTQPGGTDAFVARLSTTGTTTTTTTNLVGYLGGSGTDIGTSISLDSSLNMYVTGETSSTSGFPLKNPFTPGTLSGSSDAFVTVVGPNVSGLLMPNPTPSNAVPANAANPTVSPAQVGVGSPITFTYYIYNNGDPVPGVVFTDMLAANSGSTSASASQGSCGSAVTSGTLTCTLGTVNSSTTTSTTSGTTTITTLNYAANVTVTVTAPTAIQTNGMSIGNSASLSFPGGSTPTVFGNATVNDYTITATPTNATTQPSGAQFNYSVTVTPTGSGFPESVALSCGTVPAGTTCTFAPPLGSTISSMNGGAQTRVLGIATTARVTTPASLFRRGPTYAIWLPILGVGLIGTGVSRKRRVLLGIFVAVALGTGLLQVGCGSSSNSSTTSGTPAGTYTVDVNATSGGATRTTTVQFTVQ